MKKTYQAPMCQILELRDEDILTYSIGTAANWDDDDVGSVIDWGKFSL